MKMVIEDTEPEPEPVQSKPVKKKRVMTEEHKKKLALAREKALATRRKNAQLKKEEKQLKKQIKENELNELREKVKPKKKQVVFQEPVLEGENTLPKYPPNNIYSKKDINYYTADKKITYLFFFIYFINIITEWIRFIDIL